MHRVSALLSKAAGFYDNGDPSHDLAHIHRVMGNCERIGSQVGARLELLLPAAILHDIVNLPKNHPERAQASAMAAEKSRAMLSECGYSADEIRLIGEIIVEHSYSLGRNPSSVESAVLQDADRLDALGAIGVMRAVSCGTRMGSKYYDADDLFASERALDDKRFTVDHFSTKLFKLPELMNTEPARAEAIERAEWMRGFLVQLEAEAR